MGVKENWQNLARNHAVHYLQPQIRHPVHREGQQLLVLRLRKHVSQLVHVPMYPYKLTLDELCLGTTRPHEIRSRELDYALSVNCSTR
jgi:hypothetical protein